MDVHGRRRGDEEMTLNMSGMHGEPVELRSGCYEEPRTGDGEGE